MALESCAGPLLITGIPQPWADPFIPSGFTSRPSAGTIADAALVLRSCERIVFRGTVYEAVSWLEAGIVVSQHMDPNETEQTGLIVSSLVSDEAMAAALLELDIAAEPATFARSASLDTLGGNVEEWTITTAELGMRFSYHTTGQQQGVTAEDVSTWYPGPPHVQRAETRTEALAAASDIDPILVHWEGTGDLRRLFGGHDGWLFAGQLRAESEYQYTFTMGWNP